MYKIEDLKNTVHCADCLTFMKDIPDKSIDMVLTSPPYDNLRDYKGYTFNFEGIAKEIYRVLKDGGVCVWIVGDATIKGSETGTSFKQALYFKDIGFNLHDTMIWEKHSFNHDPRNKRYKQHFEYNFILSKGKPKTYNEIKDVPVKNAGKRYKSSKRLPSGNIRDYGYITMNDFQARSNIWKIGQDTKNKHPAPFPEKLAEDHIISWSNEGDTILDPMAGSGTTLKMAKKNNRNYIGIEIAEEYIDIINKRLNEPIQTIPMKTKSNMTVELDYKKMVKDIYKLVESDWLEDMECKWRLHEKPEEFTQEEAQEMIKILCQVYMISHCYFCTACQGKYLIKSLINNK